MTSTPEPVSPQSAGLPAATPVALTTNLALVASFAALIAVCSLIAPVQTATGVPVTLQTFAVLLAGSVLGARRGALSALLFLAVGLAGLPIFAQGVGGLGVFGRVSVGYLLAFPVAAFVVGLLVERWARRSWAPNLGLFVLAGVVGTLVIYAGGIPVLAWRAGLSLGEAFVANLVFVPFDAVKLVLAAVVATAVHRAYPDLLPRPAAAAPPPA